MNDKAYKSMRQAKARRRMELPPPDYYISPDIAKPVRRLTLEDCLTGATHTMTFFISAKRIDQFRVEVDGQPWKAKIGWSRALAALRKTQKPFSQMPTA
jgi:hypothetical protein